MSKRIRLIVTGDLERASIVDSLSRWFPGTIGNEPVEWLKPRRVNCATSSRLAPFNSHPPNPSRGMRALARAMVAEAHFGADGSPADLVVVVDDLELHNLDQPQVACAHFRAAVEAIINERQLNQRAENRLRDRLRTTCAYHLLVPMVEAYFFGDFDALVRAGCANTVVPQLVDADVENFESNDPDWLPICLVKNEHRLKLPRPEPWWREECHPKHYLTWLIENSNSGADYEEVLGGVAAFAELDWQNVPSSSLACTFARALFEDLSGFFAVQNPLGPGSSSPLTYPLRGVRRNMLLLRNM